MRPRLLLFFFFTGSLLLNAQGFKKLPDWALPTYLATRALPKPQDADDWVLLDRTEFAYTGDGEIANHRYRLVEVLTPDGTQAGELVLRGLGGKASKVKKLKGWNLRKSGEVEKLDRDAVVVIENPGSSLGVDNVRYTGTILPNVEVGSVVAFEYLETSTDPTGPADSCFVMETSPIFHWEVEAAKTGGWFTTLKDVKVELESRHFSPWIASFTSERGVRLAADNVPPLPKSEGAIPWAWNALPRVNLRFVDPDLKGAPALDSWNGIAAWEEATFREKASPLMVPGEDGHSGLAALEAARKWIASELAYKQVYLSPERSFVPLESNEVIRRRFGDCKDLASCFIGAARAAGMEAFPALARIIEGRIESDEPVNPGAFNHVIVAVRVKTATGLPSEVSTPSGRFLLVDPTSQFTPLGLLPAAHRAGRVMICADGKGIWADVPDSAVEHPALDQTLTAEADHSGGLKGTLLIRETANARDLRAQSLSLSSSEFKKKLISDLLTLPANARLEVVRRSDPLDVSKPFELELSLEYPKGFLVSPNEWDLHGLGLVRAIPGAIVRIGHPRGYPVETRSNTRVEARCEIKVPIVLTPYVSARDLDSPFQSIHWEAKAQPLPGGGGQLSLHFLDQDKPAYFGFETRDKGVLAWNQDRRNAQDFISDVLTFEVKP